MFINVVENTTAVYLIQIFDYATELSKCAVKCCVLFGNGLHIQCLFSYVVLIQNTVWICFLFPVALLQKFSLQMILPSNASCVFSSLQKASCGKCIEIHVSLFWNMLLLWNLKMCNLIFPRFVRIEESNDLQQIIFGITSSISAKDVAPLEVYASLH